MRGNRNWMLPSLLLAASLQGCAAQPSVPVVAPCPQVPALPANLQTAQFPTALQKLNETLTRHGEPALLIPPP